jgi:hypothetical protein
MPAVCWASGWLNLPLLLLQVLLLLTSGWLTLLLLLLLTVWPYNCQLVTSTAHKAGLKHRTRSTKAAQQHSNRAGGGQSSAVFETCCSI